MHALSFVVSHFALSVCVTASVPSTHSFSTHTHAHTAGTFAGGCDSSVLQTRVTVWTQRHDRPVESLKHRGRERKETPGSSQSANLVELLAD